MANCVPTSNVKYAFSISSGDYSCNSVLTRFKSALIVNTNKNPEQGVEKTAFSLTPLRPDSACSYYYK